MPACSARSAGGSPATSSSSSGSSSSSSPSVAFPRGTSTVRFPVVALYVTATSSILLPLGREKLRCHVRMSGPVGWLPLTTSERLPTARTLSWLSSGLSSPPPSGSSL